MTNSDVATIGGDAEVDHAIATLVLAFVSDPVARWMYDDPHQYLLHIPRLFRPSAKARLKEAQHSAPTTGLELRSGFHRGFTAMMGRSRLIAGSIVKEKRTEVAAIFERTEHYRPAELHWYLSLIGVEALHRNKGCGAALLKHRLRHCDREHLPAYLWSSNPLNPKSGGLGVALSGRIGG